MRLGRWAALASAALMAALSLVPPALEAGAANEGADVNVTAEFYTVLDGGGGYITWDFAPTSAARLRASIDADGSGTVDEPEYSAYQSGVDAQLERNVLVVRNFEITAVRVEEQRGLAGEAVDSGAPAHLKVILSGSWAAKDADIPLVGGGALSAAYPGLQAGERVRERTIVVAAGFSSFGASSGEARTPRVPGGSVVVHTETYVAPLPPAAAAPDVRFERFSAAGSTLLLLVPLVVAYYLGVRRPRIEQESSGRPRSAPFHHLLAAGFLLLAVAYFAGTPGLAMWVAGVGFGVVGLWATYRIYPLEAPADGDRGAAPGREPGLGAPEAGESARNPGVEAVMAMMGEAHRPVGEPSAEDEWAPAEAGEEESAPEPQARPAVGEPWTPRPAAKATPRAPPAALATGSVAAVSLVRCPTCRHQFEAAGRRPLAVACPHCGKRGVLR